ARPSVDWTMDHHCRYVFCIVLDAPGLVSPRIGAVWWNASVAPIRHSQLLDEYLLERFTSRTRRRPGAGITAAVKKILACTRCRVNGPWSHNPGQQPSL